MLIVKKMISLLNNIIPKDKHKFIFFNRQYSGNVRFFYEYISNLKDSEKYKLIWIVSNKNTAERIIKKGINCYCSQKTSFNILLKQWYHMLTAKYFFTSEGVFSERSKNQINVLFWHGLPLKTTGFLKKGGGGKTSREIGKTEFFFTTSKLWKIIFSACYHMNPEKIWITGQPRCDALYKEKMSYEKLSGLLDLNLSKYNKVILFAPTFRESTEEQQEVNGKKFADNIFRFDEYDNNQISEFLRKKNYLLLIKLHPFEEKLLDSMSIPLPTNNCQIIRTSDFEKKLIDLYEILGSIDLLITDYSGIYFDYLLLNKPIIFMPLDIEEYSKKRGFLLEPYDFWTPGPKVYSQEQLLKEIEMQIKNKKHYEERRRIVRNIVYKYQDNKSCERIWNIITNSN